MVRRTTILWVALAAGFGLTGASDVSAQSLTIGGSSSSAGPSAADFAATTIGDPWDFDQRSDYVHMFSDDGTTASAFVGLPTVSGGVLSGVSRGASPSVQVLFQGVDGALNTVGRTGAVYPIDANRFRRLSFRARRSVGTPDGVDRVGAFWWPTTDMGAGGFGLWQAKGMYPNARPVNMMPIANQNGAGWQIYRIDLDLPPLQGGGSAAWSGVIRGLKVRLANSATVQGATIDLDWIRLTERGSATTRRLQWSGFGSRVVLRATHAQTGDVIQIYPDGTSGAVDFADNSSFDWDYGYLPPGTWTVTASNTGGTTRSATLTIDAAPVLTLIEPDAAGGRDFATTVLGDPWDLRNSQDVTRYFGSINHFTSASYTDSGFVGVTRGGSYPSNPPDPFVQFLDDGWGNSPPSIPAATYHRLSFTLEYDHPELTGGEALSNTWGGIARVAWATSDNTGYTPYTITQDIFVLDGGPNTYTMDLATFVNNTTLEDPIATLWTGNIGTFRIDTDEAEMARTVRLSNVRIAADDEPNGNGFFPIRWRITDARFGGGLTDSGGSDARVTLYYDTDLNPSTKTLIASNVTGSAGVYNWSMAGLPVGVYYVYAEVSDGNGNSSARYATGPVRLSAAVPPITDSNNNGLADSWESKYGVTSASGDNDGDGVSNLQEFQQGTHPLLSNTWTLAEGATGFFAERIALANPDSTPADVTLTFLRPAPNAPILRQYSLLPYGRVTVNVNEIAGLAQADVSTVVTVTTGGVVAERTMFWGDLYYGGHTGKAIQQTGTQWHLAEGAANGFFDTFILLANSGNSAATATLTFLLEPSGTFTRQYTVPANSRVTIYTNDVTDNAGARPLFGRSFSTRINSTAPIAVERAMYFSNNGRVWNGGHEASAVAAPQTSWYIAEGATGSFFSTFLLLANPNTNAVGATVRYLLPGGQVVTRQMTLPAESRTTVNVNTVVPNTEVSAEVTANGPIIVERAMYWPGANWGEAHASAGVTSTGTQWALAEGELGSSRGFQSFILIANTSSSAATVRLRFLTENGTSFATGNISVPANSRLTRSAAEFVGAGQLSGNDRFGVLVESLNGVPIVVERAMYWNGGGEFWGGGTNETAVRIR